MPYRVVKNVVFAHAIGLVWKLLNPSGGSCEPSDLELSLVKALPSHKRYWFSDSAYTCLNLFA